MAANEHESPQASMEELYETYKPLLFSIAYRMMGTVTDAEDIVQDVFAAAQSAQTDAIRNPKAYLCKLTVNHCINEMKSARKRRERYIGPWLPEPLIAEGSQPSEAVEWNETLSYAFLVMLDRLSPMERAAFVLRTAFEFDYRDIARIVDKTETHCRKLFSNARKRLEKDDTRHVQDVREIRGKQLERFVHAFRQRNVEQLLALLTEDAVLVTDGGGRVKAALKPIVTRKRAATLLDVMAAKRLRDSVAVVMPVNGQDEIVFFKDDMVVAVFCFDWLSGTDQIRAIYAVFNPDKLPRRRLFVCPTTKSAGTAAC